MENTRLSAKSHISHAPISHAPNLQHHRKVALINDISGYGHCSTAVALPVISWLGIQCCPVPTAILSNHTGYKSCFFDDYTDRMTDYINEWKKLGISFDGIETGFLGSAKQIQIVRKMIEDFRTTETIVLVDPVMGDHGAIYRTYTDEMCREMKTLVSLADIVTPNLTEACRLSDTPYSESFTRRELTSIAEKISSLGPSRVVITGISQGEFIANFTYERSHLTQCSTAVIHNFRTHRINSQKCGTGDIFAAILTADAVNGLPFESSVKRAGIFIKKCVERTLEYDEDPLNGVCLEEMIGSLRH